MRLFVTVLLCMLSLTAWAGPPELVIGGNVLGGRGMLFLGIVGNFNNTNTCTQPTNWNIDQQGGSICAGNYNPGNLSNSLTCQNSSSSSVGSLSCTTTNAFSSGDLIIIRATLNCNCAFSSLTDTAGDSFNTVVNVLNNTTSQTQVWKAAAIAHASGQTVTLSWSPNSSLSALNVNVISGTHSVISNGVNNGTGGTQTCTTGGVTYNPTMDGGNHSWTCAIVAIQ